jgi:glyoxylase-like metal-dependent hydrolase (beta-lactamase superfamily II)
VYFSPEVRLIPLRTLGLAPSTHTNAYLVGGDPAYLLDPGTSEPAELEKLFAVLDEHRSSGGRLHAVVLTHHHPDHVGGAAAVAQRYGVPIYSHPRTAEALTGKIPIQKLINEGDCLELGRTPDGYGTWGLEAVHTPGHASGHFVFWETLSSVAIAPPDGDLAVYLASLRRLLALDCRLLLPGHGNASATPRRTIEDCLEHRARREEQLLSALGETPRAVTELAAELYKGLPAALMRLGELQVEAGLIKLERDGRARRVLGGASEAWASYNASR